MQLKDQQLKFREAKLALIEARKQKMQVSWSQRVLWAVDVINNPLVGHLDLASVALLLASFRSMPCRACLNAQKANGHHPGLDRKG